jgi:pyruvate-formate lyase
MSADWGVYCSASACGRFDNEAMANGHGPSAGADKNGLTALLNSMSKFDNTKHAGVINNIRFTKDLFNSSYDKIKTLLRTFYENDGIQTNICVIGKDDLENAMKEPEKYENLIVRIGGFSSKFINLNPVVQKELLERTTYGG